VTYLVSAVEHGRDMDGNVDCSLFGMKQLRGADERMKPPQRYEGLCSHWTLAYQCCLAGTLDAIQSNKERCWLLALRSIRLLVLGDPVEDEGDTVFGLVVDDLRHLVDCRLM
jgi:hypothetical protein